MSSSTSAVAAASAATAISSSKVPASIMLPNPNGNNFPPIAPMPPQSALPPIQLKMPANGPRFPSIPSQQQQQQSQQQQQQQPGTATISQSMMFAPATRRPSFNMPLLGLPLPNGAANKPAPNMGAGGQQQESLFYSQKPSQQQQQQHGIIAESQSPMTAAPFTQLPPPQPSPYANNRLPPPPQPSAVAVHHLATASAPPLPLPPSSEAFSSSGGNKNNNYNANANTNNTAATATTANNNNNNNNSNSNLYGNTNPHLPGNQHLQWHPNTITPPSTPPSLEDGISSNGCGIGGGGAMELLASAEDQFDYPRYHSQDHHHHHQQQNQQQHYDESMSTNDNMDDYKHHHHQHQQQQQHHHHQYQHQYQHQNMHQSSGGLAGPRRPGFSIVEGGRKQVEVACETCGKRYKNQICLQKHAWEHHQSWMYAKRLMLNKHQSVQIMEAAQALISMVSDSSAGGLDITEEYLNFQNCSSEFSAASTSPQSPVSLVSEDDE